MALSEHIAQAVPSVPGRQVHDVDVELMRSGIQVSTARLSASFSGIVADVSRVIAPPNVCGMCRGEHGARRCVFDQ